ncbi:16S rRNA (guanine(527)-N(7))-methyltransferase RsmG [Neorhizobium lilium]|uniref:Ribosomal RNA small subunit methyltransferase G n=1 Tax=Neorhizobium lilium TaxID=2503024 RepID=A0A444LAC7_9HYPH|nr:16S rRNA (guanine(527)-N(7))-methyltransferase RsmG [Neorhizobium lilium]RWX74567.1 16S rRNA (guanine(527)-N(7))-methyltransferase RsmG [Neorhizobium lilium]
MLVNGKSVSRETQQRLEHFAGLFQKWAASINLVASSTRDELWQRHIADSAQIFQLNPRPFRWLDIGSGGGFPGVVTAIFLAELQDGWVHLVESNLKKAAFLRVVLSETGARGSVHPIRIEKAVEALPDCDCISARALADLDLLMDYIFPWMDGRQTRAFLHKGRDYVKELEKAHGRWDFDLIKHRSVVEPDSVILEISQLRHRRDQN